MFHRSAPGAMLSRPSGGRPCSTRRAGRESMFSHRRASPINFIRPVAGLGRDGMLSRPSSRGQSDTSSRAAKAWHPAAALGAVMSRGTSIAAAVCWSGSREALLPPGPLRTVRESFPSYGSSLGQRIVNTTPVQGHLPSGRNNAPRRKGAANTRAGLVAGPARYYARATSTAALRMPAWPGEGAPARALHPADICIAS